MPSLRGRLRASARNALEIARFGRLGEDDWAPFDVVDTGPHHRLRRYPGPPDAPIALLIPPLMLTAEIYDVAPDTSAVTSLAEHGVEPWVVDFGAPERERGGMGRNLDDHIRAVVASIKRIRALTGKRVHVLGYSQGGMFAYQTAAFLHDDSIASLVTFGSPVDIHKNLPAVRSDLTSAFVKTIFPLASAVLDRIEGLPGKVTSTAFKIVSTRKELEQRLEFLRSLHDRDRIVKSEARRRFLGGAGFVAWPGPAFRAFVDEFVVHNRMMSGGFVVDGRTVSLADLRCPILAFVGATDEIARPATVLAIKEAAPNAEVSFFTIRAGHFGIVVGTRAMATTWPLVAQWIKNDGKLPPDAPADDDAGEHEMDLAYEIATRAVRGAWRKLGDVLASANAVVESVRWQEPRLRRLASIEPETRISPSRELARRAQQSPNATFFLFRGRAFSYRDADTRVSNVAKGLTSIGVTAGDRVGVWMNSRPSLLSTATALGRLGAVPVIAPPDATRAAVEAAFAKVGVRRVVTDPEHVDIRGDVFVLGGGAGHRTFATATDLEALDVTKVSLPEVDAGRAEDLAMVLLRPSENGPLRAVPVTNHRWALSAVGAAAVCTIEPADTVLCATPLHHPTGILVSAGAAVAGGARLALVELDPNADYAKKLLDEVHHVGATVVFYTGEMLRPLLREPADKHLPVRLWAGSGMRKALAEAIRERFGKGTVEFYAGTAHRAILADAAGDAPGSLGTVLPGSAHVQLRKLDAPEQEADIDEPGLLAVAENDGWHITADVLRRDPAGQYWFVDAKSAIVDGISLRAVEDALYTLPEITHAVAWSENGAIEAAYVGDVDSARVKAALGDLPVVANRVAALSLTEGFRVQRPSDSEARRR